MDLTASLMLSVLLPGEFVQGAVRCHNHHFRMPLVPGRPVLPRAALAHPDRCGPGGLCGEAQRLWESSPDLPVLVRLGWLLPAADDGGEHDPGVEDLNGPQIAGATEAGQIKREGLSR